MKTRQRTVMVAPLIGFISLLMLLGGSQNQATTLQATYSLITVNGKQIPSVSWVTDFHDRHCEFLTTGGALVLSRDGRSGAFAMERVNCVAEGGLTTSAINDFVLFQGSYEISGSQIIIRDDVSEDRGVLDGDLLRLRVVGIGEYVGQTTEYVFKVFR